MVAATCGMVHPQRTGRPPVLRRSRRGHPIQALSRNPCPKTCHVLSDGQNPAQSDDQSQGETLVLDLDQSMRQSALLEAIHFLDLHQHLHPLPPQARELVRRARLRLAYYFRHSHAGSPVARGKLDLVDSLLPELGRSLSQVPSRAHSLHQAAPDRET